MLATPPSFDKLKAASEQDPAIEILRERYIKLLGTIVAADNPKRLRATVNAHVDEYASLGVITLEFLGFEIAEASHPSRFAGRVSAELYETLASGKTDLLDRRDRGILLDATRTLADVDRVYSSTPSENRGNLAAALIDGFRPMQKIAMGLFAIALSSDGTIQFGHPKTVHWLCLAIRDYLNELNAAFLAYNPVLSARLQEDSEQVQFMTTEELENFLGS